MKFPNLHRTGTLLALAVLLASMTTGNLTICEIFSGTISAGGNLVLTLKAGETAMSVTGGPGSTYRFSLCGTVPEGIYYRITNLSGTNYVDIVTTTSATPGLYTIDFVESGTPGTAKTGQVILTVLEPDHLLTACFYYYVDGPIIKDQPVNFLSYCSTAPTGRTIVQYKWWFDYIGNPSSPPSATTSDYQIYHTYTTAGQRTVRLGVVADNGDQAFTAQSIEVVAP